MAVVKHQQADRFARDAIVLDMGDLRRQADQLREAAKQQAMRILAEANAKSVEIIRAAEADARKRGHEQGLAQGLEQGRKAGHAEALAKTQAHVQQLQQGWLAAAQAWDEQRVQMDRDARQAILQLGVLFAQKIVHRTIEVDSQVIVRQVAEVLGHVLRPSDVTVKIHPDDRPALEEVMPALVSGLPQLTHVRLVDDASTTRGGCAISYGQGRIDATIETQLRRLVELILPDAQVLLPPDAAPADGVNSDSANSEPSPDPT